MGHKHSKSKQLVIENIRGETVNIYHECSCTKSEQQQMDQYQSNGKLFKLSNYAKKRKKTPFWKRKNSKTNCNDIEIYVSDETEDNEPIQINGFIQQTSSSESEQYIKPNTNEFSSFEAVPSETTDCRNITWSKSSGDSGFVESDYNSFKNQTNVQSVRSNAHNGKDQTEIGRIEQSQNESCEVSTQTNLDTTLSNDGYDCATERKHLAHNSECSRLSDTERNSKPKKQIMSVSSFDSSCDNEDTLRNLNLRCESDSEELTFLKLPGPSIKQECTEIKSIFSPEMLHLVNIDQVPSSGYPLESDCDYFLTHDLSSEFSEKNTSNTVEKDLSSCSKITDDKDNTFEHVLHVSSNEFKIGKEIVNVRVEHVPETITKHCDKERISADEDTYLQKFVLIKQKIRGFNHLKV
ncbi:uncharacterized protein LOC132712797 [Ruditapes philippinarum]|uniref:uncharacterized protein LOC132712797 n=1 Tax=Ruditapes philippinarum TaxID=129788 RepID=UPI00295B5E4A|nr:uncharacterized protein LOC132712797 [Ruditapes philippinarum]